MYVKVKGNEKDLREFVENLEESKEQIGEDFPYEWELVKE